MKIELKKIKIRELKNGYKDNADNGVVGYGGKLDIRPPYQREFIYGDKERNAVIDTVTKDLDSAYRIWMLEVKKRDKWSCRTADNNCGGQLEAHHILSWKEYPKLIYEINNGITLCHAHHPRKRSEEKRLVPIFQELVSVSKEII